MWDLQSSSDIVNNLRCVQSFTFDTTHSAYGISKYEPQSIVVLPPAPSGTVFSISGSGSGKNDLTSTNQQSNGQSINNLESKFDTEDLELQNPKKKDANSALHMMTIIVSTLRLHRFEMRCYTSVHTAPAAVVMNQSIGFFITACDRFFSQCCSLLFFSFFFLLYSSYHFV